MTRTRAERVRELLAELAKQPNPPTPFPPASLTSPRGGGGAPARGAGGGGGKTSLPAHSPPPPGGEAPPTSPSGGEVKGRLSPLPSGRGAGGLGSSVPAFYK